MQRLCQRSTQAGSNGIDGPVDVGWNAAIAVDHRLSPETLHLIARWRRSRTETPRGSFCPGALLGIDRQIRFHPCQDAAVDRGIADSEAGIDHAEGIPVVLGLVKRNSHGHAEAP